MRRANVGHGLGPVSRSSGCAGGARTCSTIGGTAAAAAAAARGQRTAKTRGNRERQRQEENGTTRRTPPASNSAANAHLPRRRGRVGSLGPECHSLPGAEDVLPRQLRPGSQCVGGSNRSRQAVTRGGRVPFSDMLGILGRRTTLRCVSRKAGRPPVGGELVGPDADGQQPNTQRRRRLPALAVGTKHACTHVDSPARKHASEGLQEGLVGWRGWGGCGVVSASRQPERGGGQNRASCRRAGRGELHHASVRGPLEAEQDAIPIDL